MSRRAATALVSTLIAAVAPLLAGCGDDDRLTVLAASSLADALARMAPDARHGSAASSTIAIQVREGAPADVVALADEDLARELHREGLVEEPRTLAANRLVLLVPRGNPGRVRSAAALRRPGVTLVLADRGVPVGDHARQALHALRAGDAAARAASLEEDARGVLAKVALGEADAGIAYATDARAGDGRVEAIALPTRAQPVIRYAVAVTRASEDPARARALVARLLGPGGRAALRAAGFAPA